LNIERSKLVLVCVCACKNQSNYNKTEQMGELGTLVSVVSDYGLDDWVIEVQSSAEAKEFFL
jgi:hypothetical protein